MSQIGTRSTGGGGGALNTLTGDIGGAINPTAGGTIILAGGSNLSTSGAGNTITFNVAASPSFAGTVTAGTGFTATTGNIVATSGNIYGYDITTNTSADTTLTMEDNGLFAGGTNANVDISMTTKGSGCVVIDGIAGGGLNSVWRTCQAYVQTNDATPTVLIAIPLAAQEMVTVTATINGFVSTFDESLGGTITLSAYRPTGGDVTLVGMVQSNFSSTSTSTLSAALNVVAESVEIEVTGVAAEIWNFVATYSYMYTTHP